MNSVDFRGKLSATKLSNVFLEKRKDKQNVYITFRMFFGLWQDSYKDILMQ